MKTLALFGATGSVGQCTIDIVRAQRERFAFKVLSAHQNWQKLASLAQEFNPEYVVIADDKHAPLLREALEGRSIKVLSGEAGLIEAAQYQVDLHIAAIVGIAGLPPTFAAVESGYDIALANKETLVCAGKILLDLAAKKNVRILPVDSEHNAIFQVLEPHSRRALSKVILTASGGPFRDKGRADLKHVTTDEALKHPNWSMGAKISIDSATLANKALEMIEAVYLFDLSPEELDVVIHPQSIIHSMVEYQDGSILAQLGAHDMKVPIGYALNYPHRAPLPNQKLDLTQAVNLDMYPLDLKRFTLIEMMWSIIKGQQQMALVFNAANEVAVEAFLKQKIAFLEIEPIIQACLERIECSNVDTIENVFAVDLETRHYAYDIINKNVRHYA